MLYLDSQTSASRNPSSIPFPQQSVSASVPVPGGPWTSSQTIRQSHRAAPLATSLSEWSCETQLRALCLGTPLLHAPAVPPGGLVSPAVFSWPGWGRVQGQWWVALSVGCWEAAHLKLSNPQIPQNPPELICVSFIHSTDVHWV